MKDVMKPDAGLLIKLGSLIVHYQELNSANGHPFDRTAIDSLEHDTEVKAWLSKMDKMALLPVKR